MFKVGDVVLLVNENIRIKNGYTVDVGHVDTLLEGRMPNHFFQPADGGHLSFQFLNRNYVKLTKKSWCNLFIRLMEINKQEEKNTDR